MPDEEIPDLPDAFIEPMPEPGGPTPEEIRERAVVIWRRDGNPDPKRNWLLAEEELRRERSDFSN